jgi:pyruvate/2-oxoglutarate dehydrogenase complex dihydrolipoamide dehydrogenase (E3) component
VPPIPGLDELDFLTNENVFDLDLPPESVAVLGGGAVGCELAQAFGRLGTRVTVIEALDRLVPREEPEASRVLHDVFRADGIDVRVDANISRVEPLEPKGSARLHMEHGPPVSAARVLVAVGRTPVTEGLGLDAAGIETDGRGFIRTDDRLATSARGIYAVGDVAGKIQFTHSADEMGRIAVTNALMPWRRRRFRAERIPAVTFTTPEIARVGLTEREARRDGRVSEIPLEAVDSAVIARQTDGFVKLIARPRPLLRNLAGGRLVGATIVAPRGGEIVHEAALALSAGMFPARLALTVHAYPTWSVSLQQAAAQFFVEVDGRRDRPVRHI